MKTVTDYLIEWTENINWKKHLLNSVLQNSEIDIEMITNEIIDIIVNNKTISLIIEPLKESEKTKLFVKEIRNPVNINALCPDANCKLGKRLNVFYGENGTGKSSYVKVFRKLSTNFHTTEKNLDILPNIYNSSSNSGKQLITLSFFSDDENLCTQCIDVNENSPTLSKINVFDSSSITPLLNTDLTFSVLPQGFKYFLQLTDLIDLIKEKIQEEINNIQSEQDKIFSDSFFLIIAEDITKINNCVNNISNLENYLQSHYTILGDIDAQIEKLDKTLLDLQNSNPLNVIKILNSQRIKLEAITQSFETLSKRINSEKIAAVNSLINQYNELLEKEKVLNEEFKDKVNHIESVNNEWMSFLYSAIEYYKSVGTDKPEVKSKCILCGQSLEKKQIDLITTCFQHANSDTIKRKNKIEESVKLFDISDITVTLTKEEALLFEDKQNFVEELKTTINLVNKNMHFFKTSIEKKEEVSEDCIINFEDIISKINKETKNIRERLDALGKTNQQVSDSITQYKVDIDKLKRIKIVNDSKEKFFIWHKCKENIKSLNNIKMYFSTTSLSNKSKEAFKDIVASDYISTFQDYCKNLGTPIVGISLTSKKGQTQRGKYIVNEDTKVTDILSEGEQKAIALAEFAADLKIRENYCTTLFDDPVNSMDYKRAEKFAKMIYEISNSRQVIVFTHNIMFYYYLYNCCLHEKNKENKFFKVDAYDRDNKGLISLSAEGRLENLTEITKKIKSYSQKINSKKCLGDELEEVFKSTYSDIRTWCELIVEEGFLKKIIRRYEPNIIFQPASKITPDFINFIPDVANLFDKSCRYMRGHSQPAETQNVKPTREEYNNDFKFISELTERYKN